MQARVLIAGGNGVLAELGASTGSAQVVGHVRTLDEVREALRRTRPSVLVLDRKLAEQEGQCSLPALRRASPTTAILLPAAGQAGPRLVRAVQMAVAEPERRRQDDGLTSRERDVVRLVGLGHTNREIADRLVLSVRTVESHRARILRRLGLKTRAELVRWALERGLLSV
jgi:two-component system, NarL family, response regulator NreC